RSAAADGRDRQADARPLRQEGRSEESACKEGGREEGTGEEGRQEDDEESREEKGREEDHGEEGHEESGQEIRRRRSPLLTQVGDATATYGAKPRPRHPLGTFDVGRGYPPRPPRIVHAHRIQAAARREVAGVGDVTPTYGANPRPRHPLGTFDVGRGYAPDPREPSTHTGSRPRLTVSPRASGMYHRPMAQCSAFTIDAYMILTAYQAEQRRRGK